MKTLPCSLLVLLLALGSSASTAHSATTNDQPLTLAIFDFESKDEGVRDLGPKIATLLNANLSAEPQIITVERAELEKVLGEQELGLSGTVSPDTAAKVGHLTGAKVLVTGRVFKADKELILVAKIIGTETSRVYGELVRAPAAAPIADVSADLAKKIAATVGQKGDTLVAKECGFTLVDDRSKEKADVEITGDAFSAYGMRKGNLISCKSRVELKAQQRTGEILAVDRQTSVGVDIAEQTAAKMALQWAAADLAERLVTKLAH